MYDFKKDDIYYKISKSNTEVSVIKGPTKYKGDIIVPPTVDYNGNIYQVTEIKDKAFEKCAFLASIDLGNISSIGGNAFYNCSSLESIDLSNITFIGESAFYGCFSLSSINLKNLESIEVGAFINCTSLKSIDLGITSFIGESAFAGCTSLKSIDLSNVTYIGESAFDECTSLKSIELGKINIIENAAFKDCTSLKSIDLKDVKVIAHLAFSGCTSLKSIVLNKVDTIGENAFTDCTALKIIDLKNVTSIGGSAFSDCTSLKSIDLKNVKYLCAYAFARCTALKSVDLQNIENIEEEAFSDCDNIKEIRTSKTVAPTINKNSFTENVFKNAILYIPEGSKQSYMKHKVWRKFAKIEEYSTSESPIYLTIQHADNGNIKMEVEKGKKYNFVITEAENWKINSVTFNGVDVTAQMDENNGYTTPEIEDNSILNVSLKSTADVSVNVNNDSINVRGNINQINIEGVPAGAPVNVCTEDGAMVAYMVSNGDSMMIAVKPGRMYMVNVMNHSFRVPL